MYLFEPSGAELQIFDVAEIEFEESPDEDELHFSVLEGKAVLVELFLVDLFVGSELGHNFGHDVLHTVLQVLERMVPLLNVGVGFAQVL